MERDIRAAKRECMMLQAAGDQEGLQAASQRLRAKKNKYSEYCEEKGLGSHLDRTQVYGYDRSKSSKTVWAERKAIDKSSTNGIIVLSESSSIKDKISVKIKSALRDAEYLNEYLHSYPFESLPESYRKKFNDNFKRSSDLAKSVISKIVQKSKFYDISDKFEISEYVIHRKSGHNYIRVNTNQSVGNIAHELFDKYDIENNIMFGNKGMLVKAIDRDYQELLFKSNGDIETYLYNKYPSAFMYDLSLGKMILKKEFLPISDVLNGMSDGQINLGYYHDNKYWQDSPQHKYREAFAELGRVHFENNAEAMRIFDELFSSFNFHAARIEVK